MLKIGYCPKCKCEHACTYWENKYRYDLALEKNSYYVHKCELCGFMWKDYQPLLKLVIDALDQEIKTKI